MLESFPLDHYYSEKLMHLLVNYPVIGEVIQKSPVKLKLIFQHCRFFKFLPREEIIGKGRYNPWIFYVLSGSCLVMDDVEANFPIETIRAGQVFGELDVVCDSDGQKTVIADPKSEEVIVLGLDTAVFVAQTATRVLDDPTRIMLFQALFRTLQERYVGMLDLLVKAREELDEAVTYEAVIFKGEDDSKVHLMFLDIESKRLSLKMNKLHHRLMYLAKQGVAGLPEINTYFENKNFDQQAIHTFVNGLPYKLKSTGEKYSIGTPADQSEEIDNKQVYTLGELSFLVVDDDDNHRKSAVRILQELGVVNIRIEKNGQSAWNYICAHPLKVDVVLCDWIMPEMTGLDLFNSIAEASEHFPGIIFIMLTSIESKTSVVEAVESGVHGYVLKPMTQKTIVKQIQQAIKHVRGATIKI